MREINGETAYEKYQSGAPLSYHSKIQKELTETRKYSFVRNTIFLTILAFALLFVYTTKVYQYHEGVMRISYVLILLMCIDEESPFVDFPQIPDTLVAASDGQLAIYATNEYGHYEGPYPFFDDYPGAQLVEPYKETMIQLTGSLSSGNFNYLWKIEGDSTTTQSDQIQVTLTNPGLYGIDVHVFAGAKYVSTYSTHLIVRYVSFISPEEKNLMSCAGT